MGGRGLRQRPAEEAVSRSAVSLEGQCRPCPRTERGETQQTLSRGRGLFGRSLEPSLGLERYPCIREPLHLDPTPTLRAP